MALKFGVIGRHYFSKDDIERSYYLKALYENGDRIMEAIKLDNPIYFKEREKRMSSWKKLEFDIERDRCEKLRETINKKSFIVKIKDWFKNVFN